MSHPPLSVVFADGPRRTLCMHPKMLPLLAACKGSLGIIGCVGQRMCVRAPALREHPAQSELGADSEEGGHEGSRVAGSNPSSGATFLPETIAFVVFRSLRTPYVAKHTIGGAFWI